MHNTSFHTFHVGIWSRIQRPCVNPGRKTWNCSAVRNISARPRATQFESQTVSRVNRNQVRSEAIPSNLEELFALHKH